MQRQTAHPNPRIHMHGPDKLGLNTHLKTIHKASLKALELVKERGKQNCSPLLSQQVLHFQ
jgi:hypothetical protein